MSCSRNIWTAILACLVFAPSILAQEAKSPADLDRKIRVKPSAAAAKIGTAVNWESSWDGAVEKAQASGKPIFWYIATVPKTFMDRKVEIDRYMLAGPFSWPPIIERLNQDFVPVRVKPTAEQIEQLELKPYKFVEPGFLILDASSKVQLRVDHLTTLHLGWLDRLLAGAVGGKREPSSSVAERNDLDQAWAQFAERDFSVEPPLPTQGDPLAAEKLLLAGMVAFRRGDHAAAKNHWQQGAESQPDSPLAWKCAAEAEGFGPFVRGFEIHEKIPDAAYRAGVESVGSAAPAGTYSEPDLWRRGAEFLLGMQADNGGVFDSDYDFGGFDSLPNVHCAVTALVGMALLEALPRVDAERETQVRSAIERAAQFVSDDRNINLMDRDEILWAQAYRVRFLARLLESKFGNADEHLVALNRAVLGLEQIQLNTGGWHHEYANPFVTATALTALHHARRAGGTIDTQKVERGLAALSHDRFESGAYPYSSRKENQPAGRESIEASAGRIPVCETALWLWQKINDAQLQKAAQVSLEHHKYLDVAYKYDNHTSTMAYGGFFFWYDMQARAEMIARISDESTRKELAARHRQLILNLPEIDGCFVDSHELGRCYGTAMALLSLSQVQ